MEKWHLWGKGLSSVLQVGSQVVYGIHGVCCIIDTEVRRIDRKNVEYFVLEPKEQPKTEVTILLMPLLLNE